MKGRTSLLQDKWFISLKMHLAHNYGRHICVKTFTEQNPDICSSSLHASIREETTTKLPSPYPSLTGSIDFISFKFLKIV